MLKLHRLGFLLGDAGDETVNLAYNDFLQAQVDELSEVVDETIAATKTVTSDTGINKKGVVERLRAIGDAAIDHLRKLTDRRRTTLDNDLAEASAAIPTRLASTRPREEVVESLARGDPTLRGQIAELTELLKLQEIRKVLLGYSEKGMVEAQLLSGAESDLDTLLAIETAPKLIRDQLVHPDVFEQARMIWLEKNMPDQFKRLSTVETAIGLFEHNDQQAHKTIASACGVPLRNDVPGQAELEAAMAATG